MNSGTKYTKTTDSAIGRAKSSIGQIVGDAGTTAQEKTEILRDLRQYIQQYEPPADAGGQEAQQT